jgi:hypothetical protein
MENETVNDALVRLGALRLAGAEINPAESLACEMQASIEAERKRLRALVRRALKDD